jgi:hypothetical protein
MNMLCTHHSAACVRLAAHECYYTRRRFSLSTPCPPAAVSDRHDYSSPVKSSWNTSRPKKVVGSEPDPPKLAVPANAEAGPQSTASATWALAGTQPRHALREALTRGPSLPGGRLGGWFAVFSAIVLVLKAIHMGVVQRTRSCTACKGYGINACSLCNASGSIAWMGKWNHVEPCVIQACACARDTAPVSEA